MGTVADIATTYFLLPIVPGGLPYAEKSARAFLDGERPLLQAIYGRIVGRVWATWRKFDPKTLPPIQPPAHVSDAELSTFAILRQAILTDQGGVGGVISTDTLSRLDDAALAGWAIELLHECKKRENRMAPYVAQMRALVLRLGDWGCAGAFHKFAEGYTVEGEQLKRTMAGMCQPKDPFRATGQFFRAFPKSKDGPLGRTYATPPGLTTINVAGIDEDGKPAVVAAFTDFPQAKKPVRKAPKKAKARVTRRKQS